MNPDSDLARQVFHVLRLGLPAESGRPHRFELLWSRCTASKNGFSRVFCRSYKPEQSRMAVAESAAMVFAHFPSGG
jgi:hypothetical protein